jgi:hypothetical protein
VTPPAAPKLVVGGASKSGTTALYYYLRQHPEICVPHKKELHFFSRDALARSSAGPGDRFVLAEIPPSFAAYLAHFGHCGRRPAAVDISPSYLFHHEAADEMHRLLPEARVLFLLRNPADKAFAQYLHLAGAGRETLGFEEALAAGQQRAARGFSDIWLYRRTGFYADALARYVAVFGPGNVAAFYHEEFRDDPDTVLWAACTLAGVDPAFRFAPVAAANRSGRPKSTLVAKIVGPTAFTHALRRLVPRPLGRAARRLIRDWNTGPKPALDQRLRQSLLETYREDIRRVEELVGRTSGWLR